jgi:hypothetical protein
MFVVNYKDFRSRGGDTFFICYSDGGNSGKIKAGAIVSTGEGGRWWRGLSGRDIPNIVGKELSSVTPVPLGAENSVEGEEGILFAPTPYSNTLQCNMLSFIF